MRDRFLLVRHPKSIPFWWRIRGKIAGWLWPQIEDEINGNFEHYFTHKYMLYVHNEYEKRVRQLNKSITRLASENKLLRKQLLEKNKNETKEIKIE